VITRPHAAVGDHAAERPGDDVAAQEEAHADVDRRHAADDEEHADIGVFGRMLVCQREVDRCNTANGQRRGPAHDHARRLLVAIRSDLAGIAALLFWRSCGD
jgi:hypothetical protein